LRFYRGAAPERVVTAARVGVAYAGDWAAAPLRFFDADSSGVSVRPRTPRQSARRSASDSREPSWTSRR
jgi:3-methyladenine DNA glycosylase Mpg